MHYPFSSFSISIIIFTAGIFIVGVFTHQYQIAPEVSIEIDAEMIGESNIYEENSTFEKGEQKLNFADSFNKNASHQHLKNFEDKPIKDKKPNSLINLNSQKILPLYQPLPEIPEELRYQIFSSIITAKFYIDEDGFVYEVELVNPSNIPKLNSLLSNALMRWKFPKKGEKFQQIINVEFIVEN